MVPALAALALAATTCNERAAVESYLIGKYREQARYQAVNQDGNLMQVWISSDGKTYTIVTTTPGGWSCMIDGGYEFREIGDGA